MTSFSRASLRLLVASLLLVGCGDDGTSDTTPDAGPVDAGPLDAGETDAGEIDASVDAGETDAGEIDAGEPDAGPPIEATDIALRYAGTEGSLVRAYYGYELSGDEPIGLYLELTTPLDGCPDMTSPTPSQLLIVSGYEGATPGTQTREGSVRGNFFDFASDYFDDPRPKSAPSGSVTYRTVDLEAGVVTGEVAFEFDDGSAVGAFHATHCDSLDEQI